MVLLKWRMTPREMNPTVKICNFEITDKLYESANSIIYRTKAQQGQPKVILKILKESYPAPEELVRFHQELEIAQLFNSSKIIKIYGIKKHKNTLVLLVEEFGGESLSFWLDRNRPSLLESLKISIEICQGLAEIHAATVIHKDISPSNIIWNPETDEVKIIDFGISSRIERSLAFPIPPTFLEGNLFYMSPEQTGRMNRPIDYRSDFYSLGVTLYELFSGKKPFEINDALELIHSHIAKDPISPKRINPLIPTVLDEITLKCLSKSADDRYQSAQGIKADLMECLRQLELCGEIKPFELAKDDFYSRFHLPTKLYEREENVLVLTEAFKRVCAGESIFTLVSGYSGVGKSSLVQELYRPLAIAKGRYVTGKYDQYQRNIPYSALARALDSLCVQYLSESTQVLSEWREKIINIVGKSGQILIEVIGELEKIIGPQSTVTEVDPQASQNRFNQLFQDFIEAICQPEKPLVLFLDDLQWIDNASLALLKIIIKNRRIHGLHLVGAYRDNEVDSSHPLSLMLNELEKEGHAASMIHLKNLSCDNVVRLISDTLFLPETEVRDLATMIHSKTEGNAFFTTEFIKTLYLEELLKFSHNRRRWVWDLKQIQAKKITDNVVELMASKIMLLPESCKKILKLAACIGNQFDLNTLAVISEPNHNFQIIQEQLIPAIYQGILIPQGENYRRIGIGEVDVQSVGFKFQHDRVQQAAYLLISDQKRAKVHLHIGRMLLNSSEGEASVEKRIFDIVAHLNKGLALILSQVEKNRVAQLNLQAGIRAWLASAHRASFEYFSIAKGLLSEDAFILEYPLAFEVYLNLAKSCYVTARFDEALELYPVIMEHARSIMDKIQVHLVQMNDYHLQGEYEKAIGVQMQALMLLGVNVPVNKEDWTSAIENELSKVPINLGLRSPSDLINAPEVESEEVIATLKLLVGMWMSAYLVSKETIVQWSAVKMTNLCLQHGNSELTAFAFVQYGFLCIEKSQQFEYGYEFGELALKLAERFDNPEIRGKVYFMFGVAISHWKKQVSHSVQYLRKAYLNSVEAGDWTYAGYAATEVISKLIYFGVPCREVEAEARRYLEFLSDKTTVGLKTFFFPGPFCALLNLQGKTVSRESFSCEYFNEEKELETFSQIAIAEAWFYAMKIRSLYLFRCFAAGIKVIPKAEVVINTISGQIEVPETCFFSCLIIAAVHCDTKDLDAKTGYWSLFQRYHQQIKLWADHCPENFLHKYYLLQAEKLRVENAPQEEVLNYYNKGIDAVRNSQFPNIEAIAHELKGRFLLAKGSNEQSYIELKEAIYRYRLWGVTGKVKMLEEEFPELSPKFHRESFKLFERSGVLSSAYLDLLTVHKAALAISKEIDLDKLIQTMIKIVIESAGAHYGFLVLEQNGQWFIKAETYLVEKGIEVKSGLNNLIETERDENSQLPLSIMNSVIRTQTEVILSDATQDRRFGNDAYVLAQKPKSVFCMPLVFQGKMMGLIYLENNYSSDVFSPQRQEILALLGIQISISLENARLYTSQKEIIFNQRQTLAELEAREKDLGESREQFRVVVESVPYALLMVNEEGQILLVNIQSERCFGYNREELLGQKIELLVPKDFKERYIEYRRAFIAAPEPRAMGERSDLRAVRKDGGEFPVEISLVPMRTHEGLMILVSVSDITEHKKIEEQIKKHMVDLARSNAELEQFAYVASHDLRSPLKAIINWIQMLGHLVPKPRTVELDQAIEFIESNAEKATNLIDDLMEMARINVLSAPLSHIDLNEVVRAVLSSLEEEIQRTQAKVSFDRLPTVDGIYSYLQSVFKNLIQNALTYQDKSRRVEIEIGFKDRIYFYEFFVKDNGIGIAPNDCSSIFQMFTRLYNEKEYSAGSGIGLALSKKIVELFGGRIWVSSVPGEGSTFFFTYPKKGGTKK